MARLDALTMSAPAERRIAGVDVARGLAVLGMFAAHVGYTEQGFWTASGWLVIADGRSSAIFALLAGLSLALMSGGTTPVGGLARTRVRWRIAARAGVVAAIGYPLALLGTPIAVILPTYAVLFLLALPFLFVGRSVLLLSAGAFLLAGPVLVQAAGGRAEGLGVRPLDLVLTGYYPAAVWMAYVLTGLAIGRVPLRDPAVGLILVGAGAGLALAGYGLGTLAVQTDPGLATWFSIDPHADTLTEVAGNTGVALLALGLTLTAARNRLGRILLAPVSAIGATALTVYTAQVVAVAILGPSVVWEQTDNGTLLAFTLVTLAGCWLWVRFLGRGPLERLMRLTADRAAASLAQSDPAAGAPMVQPDRSASAETRPPG